MSHWDGEKTVRWEPKEYPGYPGWLEIDCGCSSGLEWSSGYEPIECNRCNGSGTLALHKKSLVLAIYPGGPFKGIAAHLSF